MTPPPSEPRKKARSIMASDSEWALVSRRARAAGLSISRFVLARALEPIAAAPEERDDLPHAVRRRMAVDLRALALAERARFGQAGAGDLWDALEAEAEAAIEAEEAAG